ncbi:MAG: hypothetical protein R3324_08030, partial [Halobacteriales archaeon]|nr:hypothetical protein [Halobacteriales archaeon]
MPKAGSSAVQEWLATQEEQLADAGIVLGKVSVTDDVVGFAAQEGHGSWGQLLELYRNTSDRDGVLRQLFEGLDRFADGQRTVVVSCEGFWARFAKEDGAFTAGFDRLGRSHDVRVVYYLRPQDSVLEAAWRQWGFRGGRRPSGFVRFRRARLEYLRIYRWLVEHAPTVDVRPRPFRRDVLTRGDVVVDFATYFLDLDEENIEVADTIANPGLPLDVINVLSDLPNGVLWDNVADNHVFNRLKDLMGEPVEESDAARESRRLLRDYCLEIYEPANRQLADEAGWEVDGLIGGALPPHADPDIDRL